MTTRQRRKRRMRLRRMWSLTVAVRRCSPSPGRRRRLTTCWPCWHRAASRQIHGGESERRPSAARMQLTDRSPVSPNRLELREPAAEMRRGRKPLGWNAMGNSVPRSPVPRSPLQRRNHVARNRRRSRFWSIWWTSAGRLDRRRPPRQRRPLALPPMLRPPAGGTSHERPCRRSGRRGRSHPAAVPAPGRRHHPLSAGRPARRRNADRGAVRRSPAPGHRPQRPGVLPAGGGAGGRTLPVRPVRQPTIL